MSSMLNDTMKTAKNGVEAAKDQAEHALGAAKHAMESAKEGTEHTFTSALSTLLKGASAVSGLVTMLRSLDRDDGLAWFGLARRNRPFRSLAIFGAGAAVGAGLSLLFAPMSGAQLRRMIMKGEKDLEREAKHTLERAESEVKDLGEKVGEKAEAFAGKAEALAGKAKDAVLRVESGTGNDHRPS